MAHNLVSPAIAWIDISFTWQNFWLLRLFLGASQKICNPLCTECGVDVPSVQDEYIGLRLEGFKPIILRLSNLSYP